MLRIVIICIASLSFFSSFSQTKLSVEHSDYKNEQILFYAYSDYITFEKDTAAYVTTDANGAFSENIDIKTTRPIFIDLGVYHCSFYAEKDKPNYILNLPEKRVKTKAEELNIYFEPIEYRLGIQNNPGKDLNVLIASFDNIYDEFLSLNFDTIYRFPQTKVVEKFESDIQNYYSEIQHPYFAAYKDYKIAELKYLGPNRSLQTITFKYYNQKTIHYFSPSYMRLFNMMYKDFFNYYANTKEGAQIENVVQEGRSVKKLNALLNKSVALSDSVFGELIILKGINDELFNPRMPNQIRFPKPQMGIILDSIARFSTVSEHRLIASNIIKKAKAKSKIKNEKVPSFKFLSIDGSTKSLEGFRGKYIYLNFMRTDVVPAMESMDRLINFHKNHKNDIEIISVFTDEDVSDFMKLDTIKYNWTLLHIGENREVLDYFNLVTWPQFHLISPEGKLIVSPAPSIRENFEIRFFKLIDEAN